MAVIKVKVLKYNKGGLRRGGVWLCNRIDKVLVLSLLVIEQHHHHLHHHLLLSTSADA